MVCLPENMPDYLYIYLTFFYGCSDLYPEKKKITNVINPIALRMAKTQWKTKGI